MLLKVVVFPSIFIWSVWASSVSVLGMQMVMGAVVWVVLVLKLRVCVEESYFRPVMVEFEDAEKTLPVLSFVIAMLWVVFIQRRVLFPSQYAQSR